MESKKSSHSQTLIQECRNKLLNIRRDLIHRMSLSWTLPPEEKVSGDEIDQAVAQGAENIFMLHQNRMRSQLLEIESALRRIHEGNFGICEETEELIEEKRLRALPHTTLSIEGAELREAMKKKYASQTS
ncbi:MAG: TraR/DksA C4-type zinc finger protein [Bdellovibrio sp.]